jgi:hypothetical protein
VTEHQHTFAMVKPGTLFAPVANSKWQPLRGFWMRCECGQPGFAYKADSVVLTWPADEALWATEADHEAAQARKSPLARAKRP